MAINNGMGIGSMMGLTPMLKKILFINVGVFVLEFLLGGIKLAGVPLNAYFSHYFALNPLFGPNMQIVDAGFWPWQFISYQFMHGGFYHIFFNMFGLWMFGSELEKLWGGPKFLLFYLLSGIGAGIAQIFISPLLGSFAPTIGASGSLYGILLAYGLTYPRRPIFMFPLFIPIPAIIFVSLYAVLEMVQGISSSGDGIAHFAHLGGALTGFLLMQFGDKIGIYKLFGKLFKNQRTTSYYDDDYERNINFGTRRSPNLYNYDEPKVYDTKPKRKDDISLVINGEKVNQEIIDSILDKISAKGYQSLSEKERYILNELSKRI